MSEKPNSKYCCWCGKYYKYLMPKNRFGEVVCPKCDEDDDLLSMSVAWNGLNGSRGGSPRVKPLLDYTASKGRAKVRIIAYRPKLQDVPQDSLKVVIQATENEEPIAEDPLYSDVAPILDLVREMHLMRNEGWEFTPNKAMTD